MLQTVILALITLHVQLALLLINSLEQLADNAMVLLIMIILHMLVSLALLDVQHVLQQPALVVQQHFGWMALIVPLAFQIVTHVLITRLVQIVQLLMS